MTIFINFLTLVLVLDCLFLMLLVLVQLPKKEAGMGQAFGGGATDALFGPGSGNALTKLTKYAAGIFLVLCLFVSILNANRASSTKTRIERELKKQTAGAPAPSPVATPNAAMQPATSNITLQSGATVTNNLTPLSVTPIESAAPKAPPATNAAGKSGK